MTDAAAPPPARPAARRRHRAAAAALGVLGAFLLLEVVFRAAGIGSVPAMKCFIRERGGISEYHTYPSNPSGEFVPLPDVSRGEWEVIQLSAPPDRVPVSALAATPWCVEYRRERRGVRGPAVDMVPPAGVARFAGVGDSFALGEGVPYEKTLFVRIAEELGPAVEMLNGAESGLSTEIEIQKLDWMQSTYACSRGLVVFTLNDIAMSKDLNLPLEGAYDLVNLRAQQLGPGGTRPWWRRASHVAEFLAGAAEVRAISRYVAQAYLDAFDPAKNPVGIARLELQCRYLAKACGGRTGLVVYPMMYRLDDGYPLQPCHDQVVAIARAAGLPVLDLAPAFAGKDTKDLIVHEIDHHPNGRAHAIAAKAVADWIRAEPRLRP